MDGGGLVSVARTLIALIGVCALAWVSLHWLSRHGLRGLVARSDGRLRLVAQLALGSRRQVYLVQADTRLFLLGAGESGPLSLIAELPADAHAPSALTNTDSAGV
jgi:flagellar biogenesis protein FliO